MVKQTRELLLTWRRWWITTAANRRAEAELRALDERELHDLGLARGGIAHAVRCGRCPVRPRTG